MGIVTKKSLSYKYGKKPLSSSGKYINGSKSSSKSSGSSDTVRYDAKTGKLLKPGQTTTDAKGITYTYGGSASQAVKNAGNAINRVDFNSSTGALLRPGESFVNAAGQTMNQGSQFSNIIPTSNLTPVQPINLPVPPVDGTDYGAITAGLVPPGSLEDQKTQIEQQRATNLQDMLAAMGEPPSSADAYAEAQKESGILKAQKEFNKLQSKLNGIVANGQASQLQLEQDAGGRGVTSEFLGRRQQEVARQSAIQALPVAAQLDAAQGNLEMATQNLNTLFKIKSDDATAKYNYKVKVLETVYDFVDKQDQKKLEDIAKKEERAYNENQKNLAQVQDLTVMAMKNGASASVLKSLSEAKTFDEALKVQGLQTYMNSPEAKLELELKKLQIQGQRLENAKKSQDLNGGAGVPQSTSYKLKAGDDPANIARSMGISVDALKAANPNIKDWYNIKPGATLEVPSTNSAPLYTGLKGPTATAVRAVVTSFKTEPRVTNFTDIADGYNFAKALPNDTTNPADDQALIYSFAKVMDPGSVVREGEYATVQKYSQSWIGAYGKSVSQAAAGTGFLTKEARMNIKKTLETKYKASLQSYMGTQNQYAQQINSITGRDDGLSFLRDYSAGVPLSTVDPKLGSYGNQALDTATIINIQSSTPLARW